MRHLFLATAFLLAAACDLVEPECVSPSGAWSNTDHTPYKFVVQSGTQTNCEGPLTGTYEVAEEFTGPLTGTYDYPHIEWDYSMEPEEGFVISCNYAARVDDTVTVATGTLTCTAPEEDPIAVPLTLRKGSGT